MSETIFQPYRRKKQVNITFFVCLNSNLKPHPSAPVVESITLKRLFGIALERFWT